MIAGGILVIIYVLMPLFFLIPVCIWMHVKKTKKAKFEKYEITKYTDPIISNQIINDSGLIFGQKEDVTVAKPEHMDGHALIVGGAGSGKSSCIAIPSLLAWNASVFAIDIKGELYAKTKHARPNIKVFNPQDEKAFGYDPYMFLKKSRNPAQEARAIAQALIPLPPNVENPFWIETAQNILTGAFLHYYESLSFIETLKEIQSQNPLDLVKTVAESDSEKARMHVSNFTGKMNDTLFGIFAELSRVIVTLVTDDDVISALSRDKVISPNDLEYGQDIYIHIPEHLLDQWKNLLGLMVNQFLAFFERREESTATPILFLLDEFARLGKIEKIRNALATLRAKKITICLIIQSLAQIDVIYGENERKVICDNCSFKAVLSATDKDSQEYFSALVGTWDKPKITINEGTSNGGLLGLKVTTNKGISKGTEKTEIIKPEEFATLSQIILLTPFNTEFTPSGFYKVDKRPYYLLNQSEPSGFYNKQPYYQGESARLGNFGKKPNYFNILPVFYPKYPKGQKAKYEELRSPFKSKIINGLGTAVGVVINVAGIGGLFAAFASIVTSVEAGGAPLGAAVAAVTPILLGSSAILVGYGLLREELPRIILAMHNEKVKSGW